MQRLFAGPSCFRPVRHLGRPMRSQQCPHSSPAGQTIQKKHVVGTFSVLTLAGILIIGRILIWVMDRGLDLPKDVA